MSRIGNKAIPLPAGVTVSVAEGNLVTVKGPKGELVNKFNSALEIDVQATEVVVKRPNDSKEMKTFHGTTRALLHNMVVGVSAASCTARRRCSTALSTAWRRSSGINPRSSPPAVSRPT